MPETIEKSEFQGRFTEIKAGIEDLRKKGRSVSREDLFRDSERMDVLNELDVRTIEEEAELKVLEGKIENAGLIVHNLTEFRYALECCGIFSPERVEDILSHENAHANKMESLGIPCRGYEIIAFRKPNGKGGLMFSALAEDMPTDWSLDKKRDIRKQIANAPEEYESVDPLSEFDRATIDRLSPDKDEPK